MTTGLLAGTPAASTVANAPAFAPAAALPPAGGLTAALLLVLGAAAGALLTWLWLRAAHAAALAAATAQAQTARDRVEDLLRQRDDDEVTARALAPVASTLARVERQVDVLERDRVEHYGRLGERLEQVSATTQALREQTATLAGSLNASNIRGMWGETQLRRVLEHAGMMQRCDFDEQVQAESRHETRVRPDVVVRLPGDKVLVVDAKAPLTSFLTAQGTQLDPKERAIQLQAHATALRRHVESLAGKDYWSAFETSPQLVVCFVPSEAVLAAAVEHDPALFEEALRRSVALASPATLLALLRTIAYTWQQEALTDNARELLVLGRELHERLGTLGGHVSRMGGSLRRSVEAYNAMVGTLESRVLVTSRRMYDLDLADAPPTHPAPVEATPRTLTAHELLANAPELDPGRLRRDARHVELTVPRAEAGAETEGDTGSARRSTA